MKKLEPKQCATEKPIGPSEIEVGLSGIRPPVTEVLSGTSGGPDYKSDGPTMSRTVRPVTTGIRVWPDFDDLDGNLSPFLVRKVQLPHK